MSEILYTIKNNKEIAIHSNIDYNGNMILTKEEALALSEILIKFINKKQS